ncbi:transposase [Streptomyces sp. NPDC086549]|uniref:transposase n=1 Tax=Streptomyces sp. NPDC086549 TaxID=3365752 RepID=UPI00381CA293
MSWSWSTLRRSSRRTRSRYISRPATTIKQIAANLGVNPETLRNWIRDAGSRHPRGRRTEAPVQPQTAVEAELAALRRKVRELEEEREIPRKAAKYFGAPRGLGRTSIDAAISCSRAVICSLK